MPESTPCLPNDWHDAVIGNPAHRYISCLIVLGNESVFMARDGKLPERFDSLTYMPSVYVEEGIFSKRFGQPGQSASRKRKSVQSTGCIRNTD